MRILFMFAVLLCTASCAAPQQEGAYCPWARQTLAAMAAAPRVQQPPPAVAPAVPAVVAVPAPPPAAPPPPPPSPAAAAVPPPALTPVAYRPWAFSPLSLFEAARPGRLTVSNFTFRLTDLQALVTPYPDCALHPGVVPRDFKLPLNATWIIATPAGSDVCWRRLLPGAPPQGVAQGVAPALPVAAEWNRAYTASGRFIEARL